MGPGYQIGLGSISGQRTASHDAVGKKKKKKKKVEIYNKSKKKKKSSLSLGYFLKKMFSMLKLKELNLSNMFSPKILYLDEFFFFFKVCDLQCTFFLENIL